MSKQKPVKEHKAAEKRRTGFRAWKLYAIGFSLALINFVWFGYGHILAASEYPNIIRFWGFLIFAFGGATLFITRPVYGYITLPKFIHKLPETLTSIGMIITLLYALGDGYQWLDKNKANDFTADWGSLVSDDVFAVIAITFLVLVFTGDKLGKLITKKLPSVVSFTDNAFSVLSCGAFFGLLLYFAPAELRNNIIPAFLWPTLLFTVPVTYMAYREYVKEWPWWRERLGVVGSGGAARFGGFYWYTRLDKNKKRKSFGSKMFVGKTTFETDPRLGGRDIYLDNDSHMITVATAGSGKSYRMAWNVLPEWKGGALILDPKGEHASVVGKAREKFGKVYYLDAWGVTDHESHGFNPLEEIDINHPNALDDLMQIVDACVSSDGGSSKDSSHFLQVTKDVFAGLMAHVLTQKDKQYHNLPAIYEFFLMGDPEYSATNKEDFDALVTEMGMNNAMGRAPMTAAKYLLNAGEKSELGGIITTLTRSLSWVNRPAIKPLLMKSSFKMSEMKQRNATVFVVAPFQYLKEHARFMRIIISMGLLSCRPTKDDKNFKGERTLFCLDEFAMLGTFTPIKNGLATLRGHGIKLWLLFQDLSQLEENYDNAELFLSQSDKQFFGITGYDTAKKISDLCGEYRETWTENGKHMEKMRPLRSPADILEELRLDSGIQYVFSTRTPNPLRLELRPFDKRLKLPKADPIKAAEETAPTNKDHEDNDLWIKNHMGELKQGIDYKGFYERNKSSLSEQDQKTVLEIILS